MPEIRAFRGLRYTKKAGDLSKLVAPPYDVMTPAERDAYAFHSPHNVVHLTLPEQLPDDRSKFVKYARAAAQLAEWRRAAALSPEEQPALYRYVQTFAVDGIPHGLTRTSLIALIELESYDKGVVLPHEQTFPKHKEDRLRILEATRAHLECIFGLFEDPDRKIYDAIVAAPSTDAVSVHAAIGADHKLEPISDPEAIVLLRNLLRDKKVWIADGHHRYETAITFREGLGERSGPVAEDFMMMALASMSDPGLVLLPTHRVVRALPFTPEQVRERLAAEFHLTETHSSRLMVEIEHEHKAGKRAFGVALPGGHGLIAIPKDFDGMVDGIGGDASRALRSLDVTILHRVILERILEHRGTEGIDYTRDHREAVREVDRGEAVGFLMNPPTVDDMRTIALAGERMPQKSTYYFPKILSGLVLWSLGDFD